MTNNDLKNIMKFHLSNFNDEEIEIDDNTIHNKILSDSDGYGDSNSKEVYRAVIRVTMKKNGQEDKPWPSDWFENSVEYLASKIL